jgi:hypothetical protein
MSVLRTIESKIEGLFEGLFGRAFRTHVQPVELARKLAKEMDEHRSVSVSRVYVPNGYTVYLSSADRQQFTSYEGSLVGELQEYLTEHARREAYALLTPPRVLFATDDDLAVGEFGIATRVVQPEDGAPLLPPRASLAPVRSVSIPVAPAPVPFTAPAAAPVPETAPSATMIYRASEPAADLTVGIPPPEPERELVTLMLAGRVHPITSYSVVIGRSRECDLRIADDNASRRHAEVVQEGTSYLVVDLGSTNGTELNGRRITREKLADGDRITIGATDIVFGRSLP